MIDLTGTWTVPFVASVLLLLVGAALTLYLRPDRPFGEADIETRVLTVPRAA
jgi:hypothetical protein